VEYRQDVGDAAVWANWTPGPRPRPTIAAPADGAGYAVGDRVVFSGSAVDGGGAALPATALSWRAIVLHCPGGTCHQHVMVTASGTGGAVTIPDHGDDSRILLVLDATDADGGVGETSVTLLPRLAPVVLDTTPSGLPITYGSGGGVAPLRRDAVVGGIRTVGVTSPQELGDTTYAFVGWSDGGAASHDVTIPAAGLGLTATWRPVATRRAPTIGAMSPGRAAVGPGGLRLDVTGGGFIAGLTTLRWRGVARPTTVTDDGRLTALLGAGDLATAGVVAITVANDGAAGPIVSAPVAFPVEAPAPPAPSPSPSPAPPAPPRVRLSVATVGPGAVVPGAGEYPAGAAPVLAATPAPGALFLGWTIDGRAAGWAARLPLSLDGDRTVVGTFIPRPRFADLGPGDPGMEAIAQLAARGVIRGYGDGNVGPRDTILRAQMAALIARTMGWGGRTSPTPSRIAGRSTTNCGSRSVSSRDATWRGATATARSTRPARSCASRSSRSSRARWSRPAAGRRRSTTRRSTRMSRRAPATARISPPTSGTLGDSPGQPPPGATCPTGSARPSARGSLAPSGRRSTPSRDRRRSPPPERPRRPGGASAQRGGEAPDRQGGLVAPGQAGRGRRVGLQRYRHRGAARRDDQDQGRCY